MTNSVLVFTRPDGIKVNVVRAMMVHWSPSTDHDGTRIFLLAGFQTVKETPEQITIAYNGAQSC